MKCLLASSLALCLVATTGFVSAQTYRTYPDSGSTYSEGTQVDGTTTRYEYARVLRVDPVFDSRYASGYGTPGQRCYERQTYVGGDTYNRYGNGGYSNGGYVNGDGTYRRDAYQDPYGAYGSGTRGGATMATVVGGIVGAAIGSQIGGGSARYATAAVGSMVGGMAGRQIYETRQRNRQRDRVGTVTVCDPVPANGDGYVSGDQAVNAYDVTYEYAGQQYTTRTNYHPGDRIRVRVDVRPE